MKRSRRREREWEEEKREGGGRQEKEEKNTDFFHFGQAVHRLNGKKNSHDLTK